MYIYITRLASKEIFSPSNKIHREVGRAKDLSASLYRSDMVHDWCSVLHTSCQGKSEFEIPVIAPTLTERNYSAFSDVATEFMYRT